MCRLLGDSLEEDAVYNSGRGVCLEGELCTFGGSGLHVLIAMKSIELNEAHEMF